MERERMQERTTVYISVQQTEVCGDEKGAEVALRATFVKKVVDAQRGVVEDMKGKTHTTAVIEIENVMEG